MHDEERELCKFDNKDIYTAYIRLWIHQNQLIWSRVTWCITIELATIAGFFSNHAIQLRLSLISIGTIIIIIIWRINSKTIKDRNHCLKITDLYHYMNQLPELWLLSRGLKINSGQFLLNLLLTIVVFVNFVLILLSLVFLYKEHFVFCGYVNNFINVLIF